jgi:UDP-N-acetylmuramyl pentapeptide synthase
VDELTAALPELIRPGDRVLVKASRGMRFERIAEALKCL